ncbi:DNA-binding protein [Pseudoxanthomonas broegbernensis]|uniref:DNA-binding protein n=1 Tax=Pseudoxanthomonas broegbernensis TaxID=83619 RepID=A0A7V8K735_9GAMM|nr:H-NS histone family protein [Pseudoxanthomonas broegbernensis]KAF1686599.1 DNA-binding protein [Pseudoxanthomonas broegbernensis]MBB6063652.1 DNA-binding protein H-NS [Pseudoxanthomonas broegbernensis]
MPIDLATLSPRELGSLITTAKKRQALLSKRAPLAQVRNKLTRLAKAEGYTVEELFGTAAKGARKAAAPVRAGRKLGKVAPKYRNPANPKETWTGRGKQPRWLAAYTGQGRDLGEFVIPGAAKPTSKSKPAAKKRVVKKAKK